MSAVETDAGEENRAALARRLIDRFGADASDGTRSYAVADVFAADAEGLLGVLVDEVAAGHVHLDDAGRAALETLAASAGRETVILESRAAAVLEALTATGVDARVLKGLAVSHLDHDEPAHRSFCDIDLLVRGSDMQAAVDVLAEAGFRRHFAEPFDGFDARVGKGVAVGNKEGVVVDLHRTLALGYFGTRLPVEELWADGDEFVLADGQAVALPRPARFVHCALHLALTPRPTLRDGLDLMMIAGRVPQLDSAVVVELAERWGCAAPVARAVGMATDWLDDGWAPAGLVGWARDRRERRRERLAMAAYHGRWAGSRVRSITAVAGLRGADRRLAAKGLLVGLRPSAREARTDG